MLNNKNILITGGTGSFGNAFCKYVTKKYKKIKKVVIYSRDEFKQYQMQKLFPYKNFRFYLGDVRDKSRLLRALDTIDYVIHAAALKQVDKAEENPMETIKTNVLGAQNVIECSLDSKVSNVIALSTDKASSPINLYGATKLCSDKLFVTANNIKGNKKIKFSVVRYGNVLGSRGSVLPVFLKQKEKNVFTITHEDMTRFNITLNEGVEFVDWAICNNFGGEIFVPKIPSFKVTDLVKAISPKGKIKIIGIRKGEKIHEEMVSESESLNTIETNKRYIILSNSTDNEFNQILKYHKGKKIKTRFRYTSELKNNLINTQKIKEILKRHFKGE
jgi:UDP-N-acetylglucosamine 4,6-dehydratase